MGVETSEPSLVQAEDTKNAGVEREQKIRELMAELTTLENQGGQGPVFKAVRANPDRAGGSVESITEMRLNLFTDVAIRMRELLTNEPDEETINRVQAALDIFKEVGVTEEEMGDIITESGERGAKILASRISLAREQKMKDALDMTEAEQNPTS